MIRPDDGYEPREYTFYRFDKSQMSQKNWPLLAALVCGFLAGLALLKVVLAYFGVQL